MICSIFFVVGNWLFLDDTVNKKGKNPASFFLPNLGYQEKRGHSDNCLNAREMLLQIHISTGLLFCITNVNLTEVC